MTQSEPQGASHCANSKIYQKDSKSIRGQLQAKKAAGVIKDKSTTRSKFSISQIETLQYLSLGQEPAMPAMGRRKRIRAAMLLGFAVASSIWRLGTQLPIVCGQSLLPLVSAGLIDSRSAGQPLNHIAMRCAPGHHQHGAQQSLGDVSRSRS